MNAQKYEVDLRNYFLGLIKKSKHFDYLPREEKKKFKKWLTCVPLNELLYIREREQIKNSRSKETTMTKITEKQIMKVVNKKLSDFSLSEFSLFGKKKGKKAAEILYEEAKNAMMISISPEARKCQDIRDSGKRDKCLDKVVMKGIVILIQEIDKRIDRCGTDKDCVDHLLQIIISLAKYSREKFGQNLDDMATKIVQRYGYTGITWAIGTGFKVPDFAKGLLLGA